MDGHGLLQNASAALLGEFWDISSFVGIMPSVRILVKAALSAFAFAESAFGLSSPVNRLSGDVSASAVCNNPQLSCHNTTVVDNLCCFNAPGGSLLQTQFWDTNPASGPADSWTIHGLWPDNCDGTYQQFCDNARAYTNISAIIKAADPSLLNYMNQYWTSNTGSAESFWEHEWGKHGTCISTLDPNCYTNYQPTEEVPQFFNRTVSLFKSLPSYKFLSDAGITPSSSKTYSASAIQAALSKGHGGKKVYIGCANGELDEIWYFYNVRGSLQTGQFVPADSLTASTCTGSSVKYLPKSGGGGGSSPSSASSSSRPSSTSASGSPSSTSASSAPSSTPTGGTGTPFSGKGYLNVVTGGSKKGCIISGGTWYTTGTCAGFTASSSGSKFTLTSSKGSCAVSGGKLTCGASTGNTTSFSADGSSLVYNSGSTFYADAVPSGSTQGTVYTSNGGHSVSLTIEWQSI